MGVGLLVGELVAVLGIVVFLIAGYWKMYAKAGQPGWAAIVPFYNIYVLIKMVGRPGWWLAMFFVPGANVVFAILLMIDLAKAFGKGGGFAVLLILLPIVGVPILAFGDARYVGPVADPNFTAYGPGGRPEPGYPVPPHFPPPQPGGPYTPQLYPPPPPAQYAGQTPAPYPPQQAPGPQAPPYGGWPNPPQQPYPPAPPQQFRR